MIKNGGDGEIRTRGTAKTVRRLSKALVSATHPRLQKWRRMRDSNPRYAERTTVFKTAAFDHSANSPLKKAHHRVIEPY